jgi:hemerythrin
MAFMEWDDTLLTGIQVIDIQHHRLVELVNEFHAQVLRSTTLEEERVFSGRFLMELRTYAKFHFAAEEMMLKEQQYPDLIPHQAEHKNFIKEIERLEARFGLNEPAMAVDVLLLARDWIIHHVGQTDRAYIGYIKK